MTTETTSDEHARRWRLVLGGEADDSFPKGLSNQDKAIDKALAALYEGAKYDAAGDAGQKGKRGGGTLANSSPTVARWLGDIRGYFPASVVKVMQQDALERLNLRQMLLQPELLELVEPDVHLVSTLLSLNSVIPSETKETARLVVRKVVEELEKKLAAPLQQAVMGSLNRAQRNTRPRHNEIDWNRTIRLNLKHYQEDYKTIIPERRVGYGRKRQALRDIILCIDQSGSMASSVVYASIFGAVLASLKAVSTRLIVFDTSIVDLTDELDDPVDVLFGTQLGGGTDIHAALAYCESHIRRPEETVMILISDLYEGGDQTKMLKRAAGIAASGVSFITLLALSDEGAPFYDHRIASAYASFGIPSFACTPDMFPDLMAAALNRDDLSAWAASRNIKLARPEGE